MKFVEDSIEYIHQEPGFEGGMKIAERAARMCYKTENLIKDGSYDRIVNDVCIKNGHTSITEFFTVYLVCKIWNIGMIFKYLKDNYSRLRWRGLNVYITTTYRTILQGDYEDPADAIENDYDKNWKDDLKYMVDEPTDYHHKRYCYKFVMDRVGGESVNRHRGVKGGVSRAQESTRYCNYHGKKFGGEIMISLPSKFYELINKWSVDNPDILNMDLDKQLAFLRKNDNGWKSYESALKKSEKEYLNLVGEHGWKAEDARGVLNLDLKTEFMMCCYEETWKFFLYRRCDNHAHPHIQKIAKELENDMKKRGII
jgi:thymidylate synthase (FAD)